MPSTLPIDLNTTGFGQGAANAQEALEAVINASWGLANEKATEFSTKVANATSSWLDTATPPFMGGATVTPAEVTEPAVSIPSSINTTDVYVEFDTKYGELVTLLSDKYANFISTYFPAEADSYAAAQGWLETTITSGMAAGVSAQLWEEDRSRILADSARAQDEALATFAARRHPLPPGAANAAVLKIQQTAQNELAKSSRAAVLQGVELIKFAVEKAIGLRQAVVGAAGDYIKALALGPDMASRLVNIGYDAQSKLITSAASFYNARTEAAKLTFAGEQMNANLEQEASKANLQSELTIIEDRLKALLAEAQAMAAMSTALFNNLHANVGANYGISYSESKEL